MLDVQINDYIRVSRTQGRGGPAIAKIIRAKHVTQYLRHIKRHSPTGFNYGYMGSGPADLALSILTAIMGKDIAEQYYQRFKFELVATQKEDWWILHVHEIRQWVKVQQQFEEFVADSPKGANE